VWELIVILVTVSVWELIGILVTVSVWELIGILVTVSAWELIGILVQMQMCAAIVRTFPVKSVPLKSRSLFTET
jgi:hypothetical protein